MNHHAQAMSSLAKAGWEDNLHPANFWIKGCKGKSNVLPTIGVQPWLAELIYDKYGRLAQLSRVHLFYVLAWLKNYPFKSVLPRFGPRHLRIIGKHAAWAHVRVGLSRLSEVMAEIDMCHLRHENNSVPHFPFTMGSWDTFPAIVRQSKGRYQPKYKAHVVKFQAITSHLGFICFLSGPHPGAMSDTTLARVYRPSLQPDDTILADLAYLSVPNCLTPFKKPNKPHELDSDALEFNRIHQFYRARVEHQFGHLHGWKILSSKYRSPYLGPLKWGIRVLCNIHNMRLAFSCPYVPYTPVAP